MIRRKIELWLAYSRDRQHVASLGIIHPVVWSCVALTIVATTLGFDVQAQDAATRYTGDLREMSPMILVGDPAGTPPDLPANHVDANVPTSPFAGVVSIRFDFPGTGTSICSGSVISDNQILTAAHCVDTVGEVDPGGNPTGDGTIDALPANVTVNFNNNNAASNAAGATMIGVSNITIHPDWNGFLNVNAPATENAPSLNDDVAVLTLSAPIPAGVPIYPLDTQPFNFVTPIIMAGYGETGDGISGEAAFSADFYVKRVGLNLASQFALDDESPNTAREVFLWDFDGPTGNGFDASGTLGNDLETTIGGGDSGGPSFIWNDDADGVIEADELTLFGINAFASMNNVFGATAGGMLVNTYRPFIEAAIIPEPTTWLMMSIGLVSFGLRRQRSQR